ncbi:serine/threonine-protein kinase [Marinagarivorans cellulosilyticus]|uniref:Eukaryotic-like serine/threonine-protein kinase n=1 Tax=Marinagarivorans cellulosilyticus TaxID=2721545 RepID=A0AAN1WE97_9GAMM|nr:serine/threonine-protein kinase [Marinagarivorans cellulosilyticus]BCD95975.1 eukaryotic-like serine/threonine-protein kinase [Marinagarivorans cellulosilyticus]
MVNSQAHQAPRLLNQYEILSPLGRGGMGLVYLARDTRLQRQVAIKCLRSELFEECYIERFKREAFLLAKLNHPNIVQIYDFIETPEQLALVMEFVEGNNLHIHLREHIVSLSQRMTWLVQIAQGLAVAHDAGIIHRDLKPENILISKLNQAKISDLGIAKSQETNAALTDHIAGSYCAMSPEQAVGDAITFKSDLFSFGILAYQLLCGAHPFGDTSNKLQMMQRIISQPPTPPSKHNPDLAPAITEILGQLLSKKPDSRPDNTHWVATQFECLSRLLVTNDDVNNDTQALAPNSAVIQPSGYPQASTSQAHATFNSGTASSATVKKWASLVPMQRYFHSQKKTVIFSLLIAFTLTFFLLWRLQPNTPALIVTPSSPSQVAKPYSQAAQLRKGLEALKLFDRPGSLETAEKSFNIILEHSPSNAAAVAGLSLVYSYRYSGDSEDPIWLQKADASAQQAMRLNAQLGFSHIAMGHVFTIKAEHDQAFDAFARALVLEPTNIFAWRGKVSALRSAQRYNEAIVLALQGLKQFPKERFFADELGTIYIDQNNYSKAEEAFRLSIERQPDAVYAYASLYIALERQNRADEAMQILQQGLQIRSSATLYGNLGNALFIRGDYLGAAAAFEAAISPDKGNPGSHLAWANLADTLRWIPGREAEAKNAYIKARDLLVPRLEHRTEDATLISRMALYLARLGDNDAAEPMLWRVIALAPKDATVHFRAGLAFELLGERNAALATLIKAVELGFPLKLIEAEPDLLELRRTSGAF